MNGPAETRASDAGEYDGLLFVLGAYAGLIGLGLVAVLVYVGTAAK